MMNSSLLTPLLGLRNRVQSSYVGLWVTASWLVAANADNVQLSEEQSDLLTQEEKDSWPLQQVVQWGLNFGTGFVTGGTAALWSKPDLSAGEYFVLPFVGAANIVTLGAARHFYESWRQQGTGLIGATATAALETGVQNFWSPVQKTVEGFSPKADWTGGEFVAGLLNLGVTAFAAYLIVWARPHFPIKKIQEVLNSPARNGFTVQIGGVQEAPELCANLNDYALACTAFLKRAGAKISLGYGSFFQESGEVDLASCLTPKQLTEIETCWSQGRRALVYPDKTPDYMIVTESSWKFYRNLGRELNWNTASTVFRWAVHNLNPFTAFGMLPVSFTTGAAQSVPVQVRINNSLMECDAMITPKVIVFNSFSWGAMTSPLLGRSPFLGAFVSSVRQRLAKASVIPLQAADEGLFSEAANGLFRCREICWEQLLGHLPRRQEGYLIPELRALLYKVSYYAEVVRANEAIKKVPSNLKADAHLAPEALAQPFANALRNEGSRWVLKLNDSVVGLDQITKENFNQLQLFPNNKFQASRLERLYDLIRPSPCAYVANLSFLPFFGLPNVMVNTVSGRVPGWQYMARKFENNNAVYNGNNWLVKLTRMIPNTPETPEWLRKLRWCDQAGQPFPPPGSGYDFVPAFLAWTFRIAHSANAKTKKGKADSAWAISEELREQIPELKKPL